MPANDKVRSKNSVINVRLDDDLRERLTKIHRRHKTTDTTVVQGLLAAFCQSVEEADAVRWPVVVLLAEKRALLAAEDPPDKPQRHRGDGPRRAVS